MQLGEVNFAVVDAETTGISPILRDRLLEVAVVRLAPSPYGDGWTITDEFVTLVNPERDVGPTGIHGITAGEASLAPHFAAVAGDLASRLEGAILAGHNVRFDVTFLAAEYGRVGVRMPEPATVCTLRLASRLFSNLPSRKLAHLCDEAGVLHEDGHGAMEDARATAHLLMLYIGASLRRGCSSLADLGCEYPRPMPRATTWAPAPTGAVLTRSAATERRRHERGYLARLVERLPASGAIEPRAVEYLSLLDRVLEDRLTTREEAEGLVTFASAAGLSRGQVLDLHREYLAKLVNAALYDGVVTEAELRDLQIVCDLLDLHGAALEELFAVARGESSSVPAKPQGFRGLSVCFTGELHSRFLGEPITRDMAEQLARDAGLQVRHGVTKALDLLVVADPHTMSTKAQKARRYGTRIVSEPVFWRELGVVVT